MRQIPLTPFAIAPEVRPYFIQRTRFFRNDDERNNGRSLDTGVDWRTFRLLIDRICPAIYRDAVPHIPGESVEKLASRLFSFTQKATSSYQDKLSLLGSQWLFAEAAGAWTLSQVEYDREMAQRAESNNDPDIVIKTQSSQAILNMLQPKQVCSGKANIFRDIINSGPKDIGLKAQRVGGWFRDMGKPTPKATNHAWILVDFTDGIQVPADAALAVSKAYLRTQKSKVNNCWILPAYRESWEFFLAGFHGQIRSIGHENTGTYNDATKDPLTGLTFGEWSRIDTNAYVKMGEYLRNDTNWK